MGTLKKVGVVGVGAAVVLGAWVGWSLGGVWGEREAMAAKEKVERTPEEERLWKDRGYTGIYIREYQKAPDRTWMFPVQIAAMIRHTPDVLKFCDGVDARWMDKRPAVPDGYNPIWRLVDEARQVRAHVQAYERMKGEIAKQLPEKLAAAIAKADADTEKGAQSGLTADFDNGRKSLGKAEDIYVLAQAVYGAEDAALKQATADVKALEARVGERQKVYWEKSKEKMKRPQEWYTASDAEKLRSAVLEAWKAKYPENKGVTVILASKANTRVTVPSFNEEEKTLDLKDISLLPVRVVVEGEPGWEWIYSAMAVKTGPTVSPVISADVSMKEALTSPRDLGKR